MLDSVSSGKNGGHVTWNYHSPAYVSVEWVRHFQYGTYHQVYELRLGPARPHPIAGCLTQYRLHSGGVALNGRQSRETPIDVAGSSDA